MERDVPYIVFEGEMARHERTIKRLVTLLILTIALLFVSNVAWLWFFNQFDYSTDTVAQDTTEGDNSYIGENGVINNGSTDSEND
jgi:hypothetical protein